MMFINACAVSDVGFLFRLYDGKEGVLSLSSFIPTIQIKFYSVLLINNVS